MDFFVYKNGKVEFKKDELMRIPEFKDLLARDKGSIGDSDGRRKFEAMNWCLVIWWINHPLSPGIQNGLSGDDLLEDAKLNAGIHKEWKPGLTFINASNRYRRELKLETAYIAVYVSLLKSFANSNKVIKTISDRLETLLGKANPTIDEIKDMVSLQEVINKMADGLPKRIKEFKESEIIAMQALEDKEFAQGGMQVEESMDQTKSIRYGHQPL